MASVKSTNTKPEIFIRKLLFSWGYRFRLHDKRFQGKPDLVLPKFKTVIFIHGCFWHYHGCKRSGLPKTRTNWWRTKLKKNKVRDINHIKKILEMEWKCLVIWECYLLSEKNNVFSIRTKIEKFLLGHLKSKELGAKIYGK